MSIIKYVHVIDVEGDGRLVRPGKGKASGSYITIPDDEDGLNRHEWERVGYWNLPEPMPKSDFKEWWNENKDGDVEPIPSVLDEFSND